MKDDHGQPSTYNNWKCRCDLCTKAWADYMRPRIKASRSKKLNKSKKGTSVNL